MKNILIILLGMIPTILLCQAPTLINYQGVARDGQFEILADQSIGIRLTLVDNNAGSDVYQEEHKVITNKLGLFNLQIGSGSNKVGDLSTINWSISTYSLDVEMDETGGSNYSMVGSSSLVSVPYALHAATVDDKNDDDADPQNELQSISKTGNIVSLSNGGGSFTDAVDDADSDANNEIQTISFDVATNVLTLSNGGTVNLASLDNDGGGTNSGTDDQVISLSGTNLSIEDGNSVDLSVIQDGVIDADANPSNEIQVLSKNGSQILLSNGGGMIVDEVEDADADPLNEIQMVIKNGNIVTLSNGGGSFTDQVTDADSDPANELQMISKSGDLVTLSSGGGSFTDQVNDADSDASNEIQALSKNGNMISLSNGGGMVTDAVEDADSDPANELQLLIKTGDMIELTNGGGFVRDEVDDADANPLNELQTLNLNGTQLSLSQGNSIDLSGLGGNNTTVWTKGLLDSIFYTLGDVTTHTQTVDGYINIGDFNSDHVQLTSGGMFVDNVNQTNCFSQINGEGSFFSDGGFSKSGSLTKDSLTMFNKGVGLITDEYGVMSPFGISFSSIADRSNLDSRVLHFNDGGQQVYFSQYGLFNEKILSPSDTYTSYSLQSDSLNMYNKTKWETVKLGSNSQTDGGELKLSYNGFPLIFAHTDDSFNGTIEINHKDKLGVFVGSFEEGGLINTNGENGFQNTYVGHSTIHANNNHGGMAVMDEVSSPKAGMELNQSGDGYIYSKGSVNILADNDDVLTKVDDFGIDILDDDGFFVGSMVRDLFDRSTGLLYLYGENHNQNVYAGANYAFGGDKNRGLVGIADSLGDFKSAIYVDQNDKGHVFGNFLSIGTTAANSDKYPAIIQGTSLYGMALTNDSGSQLWEHYVNSDDDMVLYSNDNLIGAFDAATGAYTQLSDKRAKKDIRALTNVMTQIGQLVPSTYQYISNNPDRKESLGFIAQEVQKIYPQLVNELTMKDGNKKLTLDYSGFSVLAIQGLKEQQKIIDDQQQQIDSLEERLLKIEALLSDR